MTAPTPASEASPPRPHGVVVAAFLLLCLALVWMDLGSHPLHGRSEGRYAAVAQNMANGTGWWVPIYGGEVHLEKPPLTAWCEALCIRALGPTDLAVRIPSALAGSLILITLFAFAWRIAGWRAAMLATGVMAVMPLHLGVTRLTLPDGPLALYWWAALMTGYFCVTEPQFYRWRILLWISVALGLITKGPVALTPVVVILLWLALGGRRGAIKNLAIVPGFFLAVAPLLAWAIAVMLQHPEARHLWFQEIIGRAGAQGAHPQPVWYFIPVFLAGMFPASLMLALPGLHYPLRQLWPRLRSGHPRVFLGLAVLIPLIFFSAIRGKLMTYILPACPPLALLTGLMLDDWLSGRNDKPEPGVRPPDARYLLAAVLTLAALAAAAIIWTPTVRVHDWLAVLGRHVHHSLARADEVVDYLHAAFALLPLPLFALSVIGAGLVWVWRRRPAWRAAALATMWLALVAFWFGTWAAEDNVMNAGGRPAMIARITHDTGLTHPRFVSVGFVDTNLAFYVHADVPELDNPADLEAAARLNPGNLIVVADPPDWLTLERDHPEVARQFEKVFDWPKAPLLPPSWVFRCRGPELPGTATHP